MLGAWSSAKTGICEHTHRFTVDSHLILNTYQKQNLILQLWDYIIVYLISMYWYFTISAETGWWLYFDKAKVVEKAMQYVRQHVRNVATKSGDLSPEF